MDRYLERDSKFRKVLLAVQIIYLVTGIALSVRGIVHKDVYEAVLSLALYRMLERRHSREGENRATPCLFVFACSVAVAGLFELCEFVIAPIMHRDLQHVLDTGVGDTMGDIFRMYLRYRCIRTFHDKGIVRKARFPDRCS